MKGYTFLGLCFVLCAILLATSCKQDDKAVGPEPVLPDGTQLMFANCDPFSFRHQVGLQESVTLVSDPTLACDGSVEFVAGETASWTSAGFQIPAGTYREGFHLALNRTINGAEIPAVIQTSFRGLATQFTRVDTMPVGNSGEALNKVIEAAQTGTVGMLDSARTVTFTVTALSGRFTANLNRGVEGSFVKIGADPSTLCQFRVYLDSQHGIAFDTLHAFDLSFHSTAGAVSDSIFLDFTHGAHMLTDSRIQLGDKYGVTYLAAASGGCRDTLSFWAIPPMQSYRRDNLGVFPAGNIISDGRDVFLYGVYAAPDSSPCGIVRVVRDSTTGHPIVSHPVYNCNDQISVEYDRVAHLVWVIEHSTGPDTAWGYSIEGVLDSTVIADSFPIGRLFQQYWVVDQSSAQDPLRREIARYPFTGGSAVSTQAYPTELTEQFAGGAGLGFPGAAVNDSTWSVHVFNPDGHWISAFSVDGAGTGTSVRLVMADSVIVYSVSYSGFSQTVYRLSPN
ncbi:MAG TPA: hypothetical protein VGL38_02660 [bacterium]|jgi:hypothetical protein